MGKNLTAGIWEKRKIYALFFSRFFVINFSHACFYNRHAVAQALHFYGGHFFRQLYLFPGVVLGR
jgi:hypothetical protein